MCFLVFFFHVKKNQISEEDTSICSLVLNAGMQRRNGPIAQMKINERKRVTLTDKARQSWNRFFKRHTEKKTKNISLDLESKNRCNKWGKKKPTKHSKKFGTDYPGQVEKRYKDIEYNERHADLSEGEIVGTYHFPEFGTWGHPQGRWLRAHTHKKEQFSPHKEKAE